MRSYPRYGETEAAALAMSCLTFCQQHEPPGLAGLDTALLAELALREGVAGVLARAPQSDAPEAPGSAMLEVRKEAARTFARNVEYLRLMVDLDHRLHESGAKVIVLKGGALLFSLYAGHLSARPLSDINLLPRPESLPHLERALADLAFTQTSPWTWTRDNLSVDVHPRLIASRIRTRGRAYALHEEALWRKAQPLEGHRALFALDPGHHFSYLTVHALKHAHGRLVWLLDLGLYLHRHPPQALADAALETGTARPVAVSLACLRAALGLDVPPLAGLPRLNLLERLYVEAVANRRAPTAAGEALMAFAFDTWRDRLAYLWELCFPGPDVLAALYPDTPPGRRGLRRLRELLRMAREQIASWVGGLLA